MQREKKNLRFDFPAKNSSSLGKEAEDAACRYLRKKGYRILKRNYTCRFGEIDIIAAHTKTICFVEVKKRANIDFGPPSAYVTLKKQAKIKKTALFFITAEELKGLNFRFDVVSLVGNQQGSFEIELIEGAFM